MKLDKGWIEMIIIASILIPIAFFEITAINRCEKTYWGEIPIEKANLSSYNYTNFSINCTIICSPNPSTA